MKEIRCRKCNRLLMKGEVLKIEIKCPKCGYIQSFLGERPWGKEVIRNKRGVEIERF